MRQTLNYQGNDIGTTKQAHEHQGKLIQTLEMRAEDAYGVDIDQEMGKLLELQNAYSANARGDDHCARVARTINAGILGKAFEK